MSWLQGSPNHENTNTSDLMTDPRWQRFNSNDYTCSCCGKAFGGMNDIGYDHPDPWPHGNLWASDLPELIVGQDYLGPDICQWQEHRFIRCILSIPVLGSNSAFCFGPWASVHPDNFDLYVNANNPPNQIEFNGCFAWLMNKLPGLESTNPLACNLAPGAEGQLPSLYVQDGPLKNAQKNGISFDQLLDLYADSGNDIRPHLMQS